MYIPISFTLLTLSLFSRLVTSQTNEPTELRLMHRVVHPDLPVTPWADLGTVSIPSFKSISPTGSDASLSLAESLRDDLAEFREAVNPNLQGAMYHVAIELPESQGSVSSIKAVSHVLLRAISEGLICSLTSYSVYSLPPHLRI